MAAAQPRALVDLHDLWEAGLCVLPPPWFCEVDVPACGAELNVSAEAAPDGIAGRFICDRPQGHHRADPGGRHRQVTDRDRGETMEWTSMREPAS